MAKLYFRYGAMGSSKTANAVMVQYNYRERGQNVLMLKPKLENRDGANIVRSRCGLVAQCRFVEELGEIDLSGYNCVIVDECHFMTAAQVRQLVDIVDEQDIHEFDNLAPWYEDVTRWAQLGRLGVAHDAQGHGIARKMLAHAMDQAKERGCQAVRFLVATCNIPAQRSYAKLNYEVCGECSEWEGDWLCYEKRLTD